MVFTETWLHQRVPDSLLNLGGYSLVRADRSDTSGKRNGGGIGMYVSDKWCKQYTVRETICSPDVELLCISMRPHYLPREFGNIIIAAVYVPPSANAGRATARIAECAHEQLQRSPGAPIFFLDDYNHCKLESALPGFQQYVKYDTRNNRILDKCYGNIKGAYSVKPKTPISNSDHNTLHLILPYKSVLKSSKPEHKSVYVWSDDAIETLKGYVTF